jgi:uncharacterized protein (TIRG00374 family)
VTARRRAVLGLLGLATSLVALIVLIQVVDLGRTAELLAHTDPVPLVLALIVVALQLIFRGVRWGMLLPRVGNRRISTRRVIPVLLAGYLGNIALPARLGEVVRAYLISRREALAFSHALGTVAFERVMDLASLALVGFTAAALSAAPAWMISGTALVGALGLAVTGFLVLVGVPRLVRWGERVLGQGSPRLGALAAVLVRFGEGAGAQPRRVVASALAISVACWLLDGTTFWLAGRALGADVDWPAALLMATVTVLGTAIPSAPGYVGTFELAAVAAGSALGVAPESALAIAVITHVITTVPLAIGGAASLSTMTLSLGSVGAAAAARRNEETP